jgi:hypothetical protein
MFVTEEAFVVSPIQELSGLVHETPTDKEDLAAVGVEGQATLPQRINR